jgi:NAD(P)-dependent dehydrogenase (short-subunit alcohol dehydrogenase family)
MSDVSLTLVTGASSGIGRQVAIQLSQSRSLILHGRDLERLNETIRLCSPGNHIIWNYDLENVVDLSSSLLDLMKKSDFVISDFVHCAGVSSVSGARLMTALEIQKTFNINTISALVICSSLLKKTNKSTLKNILFISSIWSQFGAVGHTVYSSSKGAVDSAMRSLAVELAPKIRVNSLALGAIDTPMSKAALSNPEIRSHTEKNYPLGIGTTDNVASVCEFILSDSARWITGQAIVVDGGRTAHMSNK